VKRARAQQLALHAPLSEGILCGRNMELLRWAPDGCFDSVVTDPPYELEFMAKAWDGTGIAFSVPFWREVLRVLKPGGHLLAFGGTRTYHRMTCAIEDAGLEVRDSLHWVYGTGFPKSLNVSKAIDDAAGAEREVVGKKGGRYSSPKQDFRGGTHHAANGAAVAMFDDITAPATEAAKQWDGWGTALKPGHEPIVLARKPLAGTVAANVLAHGTGGLNIDACRIGSGTPKPVRGATENTGEGLFEMGSRSPRPDSTEGRWPANVLLDEGAALELDAQTEGVCHSAGKARTGSDNPRAAKHDATSWSIDSSTGDMHRFGDSGGASRFFYVAKPSRRERDLGCEHLPARTGGDATDREDVARNYHPTVKPIDLMRWLVRLVTPPQGWVLDPFVGSGTTAIAATLEGARFTGIEQDEGYCELARARMAHWKRAREAIPDKQPQC
jgi:DNA modification methylase